MPRPCLAQQAEQAADQVSRHSGGQRPDPFGYQKPADLLGKDGLLERAMGAELTVHLGYGKHDPAGKNSGNSRNGTTPKTLKGEFGNLALETPRDRNGSFEPQIVAKGQRRFEGFDQAILSLYLANCCSHRAGQGQRTKSRA